MRDSLLKATGELNPAIGGLPVMPEINMEMALQPRMIQFSRLRQPTNLRAHPLSATAALSTPIVCAARLTLSWRLFQPA